MTREDARHIVACSIGDDSRGMESVLEKMYSTLFGLVHVIFSCEAFRVYNHFLCGLCPHFTFMYLQTGKFFLDHGEPSPSLDWPSLIHRRILTFPRFF